MKLATYEPNIVVNGDTENVIFLDADKDRATSKQQGAIKEERVNLAILKTLDRGDDAFSLCKAKYGF